MLKSAAMAKQTPLMKQYTEIKGNHPDSILFYRLGDFYEMFFEDAQIAAEELEITLTARGEDENGPIPLAGVPYHAYKGYASKLLKKGYKVAICEQIEDPKKAKGIVKRAVTHVLTPGTVLDDGYLDDGQFNYLLCLRTDGDGWAAAYCDVSAGDAHAICAYGAGAAERIIEEVVKIGPAELIGSESLSNSPVIRQLLDNLGLPDGAVTFNDEQVQPHRKGAAPFYPHRDVSPAVKREPLLEKTLASLAGYVARNQEEPFEHFKGVAVHDLASHMGLDPATVRNLELLRTIMGGDRKGSLLSILDKTVTAMGSRLLKYWLLHPLTDKLLIEERQERLSRLIATVAHREGLREHLKYVYDIPRIVGRISTKRANGRDLVALLSSLKRVPDIANLCQEAKVADMADGFAGFAKLLERLEDTLAEAPPLSIQDGGLIKEGFSEELDRLRKMATSARDWLEDFQQQERERTGIKSLKVRYNKVFGYYIEVTRANLQLVPQDYQRKQTLVNAERFITDDLKVKEKEILSADERSKSLEYELFCQLREDVSKWTLDLQEAAGRLAELDVICSLAEVCEIGQYVRPKFTDDMAIKIKSGRHPVVERLGEAGQFVPNDVALDSNKQVVILTGPNMSGKSTYLRQTALIVLLAQIGSYVPADKATLPIVDKIFTRVGAGDDLSRGESTFMVEMKETAHILQHATPKSLIILDEVGRGTSTYDGLSLAWAIVEYLNQVPERKAKTLFATHYHELTEMADIFSGIENFSVMVEERGDDVLFLHRIVKGSAGRSYGIHVAKLAGFPQRVLDKANEVLFQLEQDEQRDIERKKLRKTSKKRREREAVQLSLFPIPERSPILEELRRLKTDEMTPLDALNLLARWRKMV